MSLTKVQLRALCEPGWLCPQLYWIPLPLQFVCWLHFLRFNISNYILQIKLQPSAPFWYNIQGIIFKASENFLPLPHWAESQAVKNQPSNFFKLRLSLISEQSSKHLCEARRSPFVTFCFLPPNKPDRRASNQQRPKVLLPIGVTNK